MNAHALGLYQSLHLAQVIDNDDPDGRGRIKVMLLANELQIWASAVVPSAGQGYGISGLPRISEVVVIAFISPDQALLLGSIWSGGDSMPDDVKPVEERYALRSPSGMSVVLDDADGPSLTVTSPNGYSVKLTDGGGGSFEVSRGGQSVIFTESSIDFRCSANINIDAGAQVTVNAPMVKVNASLSEFSGVVKADTVITNAVISSSYTPGAGNIW